MSGIAGDRSLAYAIKRVLVAANRFCCSSSGIGDSNHPRLSGSIVPFLQRTFVALGIGWFSGEALCVWGVRL